VDWSGASAGLINRLTLVRIQLLRLQISGGIVAFGKTQRRRIRVYAQSNNVMVHADITVQTDYLSSQEHRSIVSQIVRGIPALLERCPYTDFGIDNIEITQHMRWKK
jgi:hypothetical protein